MRPDDALSKSSVIILALLLPLKAADVARYWFESQLRSKYVVWTEGAVCVLFAGVKIGLIIAEAPLIAFIWAVVAEATLCAAGVLSVFAAYGGLAISNWRMRVQRARSLLSDSWPMILSGIAIMVYMRIDQIMLGLMIGDESVGIYTAAVKISEVIYFVPMAIAASVFPAIIESRKKDIGLYYRRMQRLFDLMVYLSVTVALPMSCWSDWVVHLLFGDAYIEAGPILSINVWAGVFVFLGVASSKWYITENLQRINLLNTSLGAIANVILNCMWIPRWGAIGAAVATVVSQAIVAFAAELLYPKTRVLFRMKLKSLIFQSLIWKAIK